MIRTTVMLPEETHERLRRLARRRGVPLAVVIREALTGAAESEARPTLSFVGAAGVEGVSAAELTQNPPPLTPPVSYATPEELEELRRRADAMARRRSRLSTTGA